MTIAYISALAAALCWAFGGLIAIGPVGRIGPLAFNASRMLIVFFMLGAGTVALGSWATLQPDHLVILALSGGIGILLGDTLLFLGLQKLGPRRNAVLYATNAPLAALIGVVFFDDRFGLAGLAGMALVTVGVMLAVFFGRRRNAEAHAWDGSGSLRVGVIACLAAALCQAVGTVIAKPAMVAGVDPVAASAVRVGTALVGLLCTALLSGQRTNLKIAFTSPALTGQIALSAFVGMGIGMTLVLFALASGSAGIVATLSSTTPVMILPLLWVRTRQAPASGAWAGAALTVAGAALIFNR